MVSYVNGFGPVGFSKWDDEKRYFYVLAAEGNLPFVQFGQGETEEQARRNSDVGHPEGRQRISPVFRPK